jgi:DNA-binding YbaB/EbfC family protein
MESRYNGTDEQRMLFFGRVKEKLMTKGFGNILKQAQQMHAKIAQLQEEMAGKTVEASSGGGMVNIVMNGKQEVLSIRIDPEVVNREDVEMLQDLVVAAVNEAIRKSQEMMTEEMKKVTGGLNIPGLF